GRDESTQKGAARTVDGAGRQGPGGAGGAGVAGGAPAAGPPRAKGCPFGFMLNTATIMGQKLTAVQEVEVAAKAGYDAIEPWLSELHAHAEGGGSLKDLGKRSADARPRVESAHRLGEGPGGST